jgi:hypothetical protein
MHDGQLKTLLLTRKTEVIPQDCSVKVIVGLIESTLLARAHLSTECLDGSRP